MNKIYRVLGKKGCITIPYEIRKQCGIGYNDILSFQVKDSDSVIIRKETVCGISEPEPVREEKEDALTDFMEDLEKMLAELTPEEQKKALIYLSVMWAEREAQV